MSENNTLFEIAQAIQSKETMKNDVTEIMDAVKNIVHEKYIGRLNSVIQDHQTKLQSDPPKEIRLLEAFKPFLDSNTQPAIDQMISVMYAANTARSLQSELATTDPKPSERKTVRAMSDLLKQDGVYEIDHACMSSQESSSTGTSSAGFGGTGSILLVFVIFLLFSGIH